MNGVCTDDMQANKLTSPLLPRQKAYGISSSAFRLLQEIKSLFQMYDTSTLLFETIITHILTTVY